MDNEWWIMLDSDPEWQQRLAKIMDLAGEYILDDIDAQARNAKRVDSGIRKIPIKDTEGE